MIQTIKSNRLLVMFKSVLIRNEIFTKQQILNRLEKNPQFQFAKLPTFFQKTKQVSYFSTLKQVETVQSTKKFRNQSEKPVQNFLGIEESFAQIFQELKINGQKQHKERIELQAVQQLRKHRKNFFELRPDKIRLLMKDICNQRFSSPSTVILARQYSIYLSNKLSFRVDPMKGKTGNQTKSSQDNSKSQANYQQLAYLQEQNQSLNFIISQEEIKFLIFTTLRHFRQAKKSYIFSLIHIVRKFLYGQILKQEKNGQEKMSDELLKLIANLIQKQSKNSSTKKLAATHAIFTRLLQVQYKNQVQKIIHSPNQLQYLQQRCSLLLKYVECFPNYWILKNGSKVFSESQSCQQYALQISKQFQTHFNFFISQFHQLFASSCAQWFFNSDKEVELNEQISSDLSINISKLFSQRTLKNFDKLVSVFIELAGAIELKNNKNKSPALKAIEKELRNKYLYAVGRQGLNFLVHLDKLLRSLSHPQKTMLKEQNQKMLVKFAILLKFLWGTNLMKKLPHSHINTTLYNFVIYLQKSGLLLEKKSFVLLSEVIFRLIAGGWIDEQQIAKRVFQVK